MTSLLIAVTFSAVVQANAGTPSLCAPKETAYFSCQAQNGKTISLCGDSRVTDPKGPDDSWLQYRYGRAGAIELAYPNSRKDSLARFTAERIRANGGLNSIDSVTFDNGLFHYAVEYVVPDGAPSWSGVTVEERSKSRQVAKISCKSTSVTTKFFDLVDYLQVR